MTAFQAFLFAVIEKLEAAHYIAATLLLLFLLVLLSQIEKGPPVPRTVL